MFGSALARLLTLAVIVCVVAGLVAADRVLRLPGWSAQAPVAQVVPDTIDLNRVCPQDYRSGGSSSAIDAGSSIAAGELAVAADSAAGLTLTAIGQESAKQSTDAATAGGVSLQTWQLGDGQGSAVISTQGVPDVEPVGLATVQPDAGDVNGSVLTGCAEPSFSSWLIGGSQRTGRTTSVRLVNPTVLDSEVTLTVYTENGQVADQPEPLVVPAGGERLIPVSALTTQVDQVAVHVSAERGPVAAFLQSDLVRVLQAGGVDTSQPSSAPAGHQTIVGVSVSRAGEQAQAATGDGWEDAATVIRLLAPAASGHVRITATGADGTQHTVEADAAAGQTLEVPLGDLQDGDYRIDIDADVDVVAAARSVRGLRDHPEFAWLPASSSWDGAVSLAVPQGVAGASLQIAADADTAVTVSSSEAGDVAVRAQAGAIETIMLAAGAAYVIRADAPVRTSITSASDETIAQTPVIGSDDAQAVVVLAH